MKLHELANPLFLATSFSSVLARSPMAGRDGVSPAHYQAELQARLERLSRALLQGTYRPSPLLRLRKRKADGGERVLSIPSVEDRIVLEALHRALSPRVEASLSEAAHAYRPGRSARGAVEAVQKQIDEGNGWVFTTDIRNFFDSIPIIFVISALRPIAEEEALLSLLDLILQRHALLPGRGLAQGSSLSPLLSNLVLADLDGKLRAAGYPLVRYSDNLCCSTRSQSAARQALELVEKELGRMKMALKPGETRICRVSDGFLWLGFWVTENGLQASEGAIQALRERLDVAAREGAEGLSMQERLMPVLRGWSAYFRAPLPLAVSLGPNDALARKILAELNGRRAPTEPQREQEPGAEWFPEAEDPPEEDPWELTEPSDEPQHAELPAEIDALYDQAERLAARGSYLRAEQLHEEAERRRRQKAVAPSAPVEPEPVIPAIEEEAIDAFLGLFCAGQELVELAPVGTPGSREFERHERPPRPGDVRRHLAGQSAVAILPRLPSGFCTVGVIDLDARHEEHKEAVVAFAQALVAIATMRGVRVLIEPTGGRGLHLWVPVDAPMAADSMFLLLRSWLLAAGSPSEGVRVELLPAPQDAVDLHQQSITLPLGVHVESGQESQLRWSDGTPVTRDLQGIFRPANSLSQLMQLSPRQVSSPQTLAPALREPTPQQAPPKPRFARSLPIFQEGADLKWVSSNPDVQGILERCALLRHLARKSDATGHLDHAERLSLLYSIGHLGTSGEQAIHAVLHRCRNYSETETSRQIGRKTGLPISCQRLREKHAEEPPLREACNCDFGDVQRRGGYPTPLLHVMGFRRTWREALIQRKDRRLAARKEGVPGVVVKSIQVPELEGAKTGIPPHEWA